LNAAGKDLGTFGGTSSAATAINRNGTVVGTARERVSLHAFIFRNDRLIDITPMAIRNSEATAVNDSDEVVGYIDHADTGDKYRAFLWKSGKLTDLGALGGDMSEATSINNHGDVVGWAFTRHVSEHAFLYASREKNAKLQDLGTLGGKTSEALGINDSRQIVGCADGPDGEFRAFIWISGKMYDLNQLIAPTKLKLFGAGSISNKGLICGWGYLNNVRRAFLLIPIDATNPK
jgi:probable HAF family extracellular repeat protein